MLCIWQAVELRVTIQKALPPAIHFETDDGSITLTAPKHNRSEEVRIYFTVDGTQPTVLSRLYDPGYKPTLSDLGITADAFVIIRAVTHIQGYVTSDDACYETEPLPDQFEMPVTISDAQPQVGAEAPKVVMTVIADDWTPKSKVPAPKTQDEKDAQMLKEIGELDSKIKAIDGQAGQDEFAASINALGISSSTSSSSVQLGGSPVSTSLEIPAAAVYEMAQNQQQNATYDTAGNAEPPSVYDTAQQNNPTAPATYDAAQQNSLTAPMTHDTAQQNNPTAPMCYDTAQQNNQFIDM